MTSPLVCVKRVVDSSSEVVLTEDGGKGAAPAPRKRSAARKPRVRRPPSAVRDD